MFVAEDSLGMPQLSALQTAFFRPPATCTANAAFSVWTTVARSNVFLAVQWGALIVGRKVVVKHEMLLSMLVVGVGKKWKTEMNDRLDIGWMTPGGMGALGALTGAIIYEACGLARFRIGLDIASA